MDQGSSRRADSGLHGAFSGKIANSTRLETLAAAVSSVILADSLAHFRTFGVMNALSAIYEVKNTIFIVCFVKIFRFECCTVSF